MVQLGERLFSDPRLSGNGRYSCASCHQPDKYFTDQLPLAIGAYGDRLPRNTPTLLKASQQASFGWTNDGINSLAQQHLGPLLNRKPVEMGFSVGQLRVLDQDTSLAVLRRQLYPNQTGFSLAIITEALAAYVSSLPYRSHFDDYLLNDNKEVMGSSALRGLELFTSERLGCSKCHNGPGLGGGLQAQGEILRPAIYEPRQVAEGLLEIRVPSLRAISFTAPYMIDGRIADLAGVLAFYQQNDIPELTPFELTSQQTEDLLAFLSTL